MVSEKMCMLKQMCMWWEKKKEETREKAMEKCILLVINYEKKWWSEEGHTIVKSYHVLPLVPKWYSKKITSVLQVQDEHCPNNISTPIQKN